MDQTQIIKQLEAFILTLWSMTEVKFILGSIGVNVVLAVAVALRSGAFSFRELGTFLKDDVVPYVLTYGTFKIGGDAIGMGAIAVGAYVLLQANLLAKIVEKLGLLNIPIAKNIMPLVARREIRERSG